MENQLSYLDRSRPVALYHQLAEMLRREMNERGLRPGDLLATEEQLQTRFGVSRSTARRALQELEEAGLVERVTGKGTLVAPPKLRAELSNLLSFTEEITRLGMTPSSQVVSVRWIRCTERVSYHLGTPEGSRVLEVRRVRLADGEPMMYLVDHIPARIQIDENDDFSGSLYALFERKGFLVRRAVHRIEAGMSDAEVSLLLNCPPGSPILIFKRTTFDQRGEALLYEEASCRADRYRYTVELIRSEMPGQD